MAEKGMGVRIGRGEAPCPVAVLMMVTYRIGVSGVHARSRRLLVTTLTELKAMAALARMGLSMMPQMG